VPERYELALDGMTLDNQLLQTADPVLRELGLSNEQAGKLLPGAGRDAAHAGKPAQPLCRRRRRAKRAWAEEFAADPKSAAPAAPRANTWPRAAWMPWALAKDTRSARPWPTAALATTPT
jgi:hypothetical protein